MGKNKPSDRIRLESVKPCCASYAKDLMRGVDNAKDITNSISTINSQKGQKNVKSNQNDKSRERFLVDAPGLTEPLRETVHLYDREDFNRKLFIWLTFITLMIVVLLSIGAYVIVDIQGGSTEPLIEILRISLAPLASFIFVGAGYYFGRHSKLTKTKSTNQ